jgi:Ribbon-helix-helix protein, copG family
LKEILLELYNSSMTSKQKRRKKAMNDQALKVRTVVMPDNLWDALRIESIREKRSASDIIRQLVSEYLKKGGKRS